MRIVHLIFYSFYKTASQINRIIPLKGGGIGGAGTFLGLLFTVPFVFVFKLSRTRSIDFESGLKYLSLLIIIGVVIFYFDFTGCKIIKEIEKEEHSILQRILLANGFLIIYVAAFIYFLK